MKKFPALHLYHVLSYYSLIPKYTTLPKVFMFADKLVPDDHTGAVMIARGLRKALA